MVDHLSKHPSLSPRESAGGVVAVRRDRYNAARRAHTAAATAASAVELAEARRRFRAAVADRARLD